MYLERLAFNKLKIYLTSEEITVRGLTEEEIWKILLAGIFFADLLKEAEMICGLDIDGTVTVEIFAGHSRGLILIVTFEGEGNEHFPIGDEFLISGILSPKGSCCTNFPISRR